MRKNLSQKDWDGFVETYGIPPIFLTAPQGTSTTQMEAFEEVANRVIANSRGALPNGTLVQTIDVGVRGANPFKGHLEYQDEQIVLAATSGLLTTLAKSTGMNSGNAEGHGDAFVDIGEAEALAISEVFQKQFDGQFLVENFASQEPMVYFELAYQEVGREDGDILVDAKTLKEIGYNISKEQLEEKTGYVLEEVDVPEEVLPEIHAEDMPEGELANRIFKVMKSRSDFTDRLENLADSLLIK